MLEVLDIRKCWIFFKISSLKFEKVHVIVSAQRRDDNRHGSEITMIKACQAYSLVESSQLLIIDWIWLFVHTNYASVYYSH